MSEYGYRFEREVRAVPLWLIADYLRKLGGTQVEEGVFRGAGWQVSVRAMEPVRVRNLRLGRVWLVVEARDEALFAAFYPRLEMMLWRGGG